MIKIIFKKLLHIICILAIPCLCSGFVPVHNDTIPTDSSLFNMNLYNNKIYIDMEDDEEEREDEEEYEIELSNIVDIPIAGISLSLSKVTNKDEIMKIVNGYDKRLIESLSSKDISMIERLVEAESTAGSIKDKTYVASVVLNRLKSKDFPDTVRGIIFQKGQFSPISDGRYYSLTVTDETKEAVKIVLENGDTAIGALFFCNLKKVKNSKTKAWFNNLEYLFTDDIGQCYYK